MSPLIRPKVTPDPESGTFPAEILSYELRESKKGNEYFSVASRVHQGEHSYISYGIVMNVDRDVARFFSAAGLPEEAAKARDKNSDGVNWDKVIGAQLSVVTEAEAKGDGRVFLNTKAYLPMNAAVAAA